MKANMYRLLNLLLPLKNTSAPRSFWLVLPLMLWAALAAQAQSPDKGPQPLTQEDYKKALAFKIANPDENTYIKIENTYILDREAKPYVFKYSDGIERRIYLYKLMKGANREEVATLALYATPKSGKTINVCIPNSRAEKQVWDLYIDDLKLQEEKEKGFLSTLAFVLSREYAQGLANPGMAKTAGAKDAGDYDFCFPAFAQVRMADGSLKAISAVKAGDLVMAYDAAREGKHETTVKAVSVHGRDEGISLTQLTLVAVEDILASAGPLVRSAALTLEATGNHPVHTREGRKEVRQIREGDVLYAFDHASQAFREYRVEQVQPDGRVVKEVYNLHTASGNYLVEDLVVLDK
ncbi:hypothetical protein BH24BAC1_BH24BAC1_33620 [soil metagenome]